MGCRTSQERGSRKVGTFQELEVSSGLATLLQGLGEITLAVFDILDPASSSLSIYPSRSGSGGRKGMPPSNPSLEEMSDSDSGHKRLGQEGALSTFCSIRPRSVDKPCTVASGPCLLTKSMCLSSASAL